MDDSGLVRCGDCGAVNRLRGRVAGKAPKCGACGKPLRVADRPVDAGAGSFDREVLQWPGRVLVDFWSPTCGHCLKLLPVLDDLARETAGRVKIVKVNIMEERSLAGRYDVQAVPTLHLYEGGTLLGKTAGALPADRLRAWMLS